MVQNLFDVQNQSKLLPALLPELLKVLHTILSYNLPTFPRSEVLVVSSMLMKFIENIILSSIMSERLRAVRVLVDILSKFLGRPKLDYDEMASTLADQLITFIMDHISVLVKSTVGRHIFLAKGLRTTMTGLLDRHQSKEELEQEVTSLLKSIFYLVENHSNISSLVLDRVGLLLEHLVSILDRKVGIEKEDLLNCEILECGEEDKTSNILKLVVCLTKIIIASLENLEIENAKTFKVLNSLKLLIDYVCKSVPFGSCTHSMYLLLLHFHSAYKCIWVEMNPVLDDNCSGGSFLQHDTLITECAKKMLERRDNWSSYKAGKRAACLGQWSNAAFIFEQLSEIVLSDSSYIWLNALTLLSHSESQIEYFGTINVKDSLSEAGEGIAQIDNSGNCVETLVRAYNGVRLAERTLRTSAPGPAFTFQRWFLALRAKFLEILVDITALLGAVSFVGDSSSCGQKKITVSVPSLIPLERFSFLVNSLTLISYRLKKLADEFDLLATSFVGMDRKSMRIISSFSASCSLLAFCTGLALSIPYSHVLENIGTCSLDSSEEKFHAVLIQDLVERLWFTDSETSKHLWMLLKVYKRSKSCFLPKSRSQAAGIWYGASAIVKLCKYAVTEIVGLQNKASTLCGDESKSQISNHSLKLLLSIIWKWMQIPFSCPNHFFQVRDNVFSELFAMTEDGKSLDGKVVSLGSHLWLNLCLQLKNMPPSFPLGLSKLYCILSCTIRPPHGKNKEQSGSNSEEWETDDILELNEKLVQYVTGSATRNPMHNGDKAGSCSTEDEYLCFHPNERGQGFSTCLLDVSAFPVGNYKIKWHSCWVDNGGSCGSLLSMNAGPNFSIEMPYTSRSMQIEVP